MKVYLDTVKHLKYTSILKIQEDDAVRRSKSGQEISNTKDSEENFNVDENMEINKDIQLDDYTNESMAILVDYINLISKEKK